MSIVKKIWLSVGILVTGYFVSMLFSYSNGLQTEQRLFLAADHLFPATGLSIAARTAFDQQVFQYNDSVMLEDDSYLEDAQKLSADLQASLEELASLEGVSIETKSEANQLAAQVKSFTAAAQTVYAAMINGTGDEEQVMTQVSALAAETTLLKEHLAALSQATATALKGELSSMSYETRNQRYMNLLIFICVVVGSMILISVIIIRSISRPLKHTVAVIQELAKGDLSSRFNVNSNDEIGQLGKALNGMTERLSQRVELAQAIAEGDLTRTVELASDKDTLGKALQTMVGRLNQIIGQLHQAGDQVSAGSGQVSASSHTLSQASTEQAASLEEITASIVEIGSQAEANATGSTEANKLADVASDAAKNGVKQMEAMTRSMDTISQSSQAISKIIKVIDEIAFQTNLLALNAAVEAARAGQHGKGFAVVAEEVRNLAGRSAKAAQETTDLIDSSVNKVTEGCAIVETTATALDNINASVTKVTGLIGEIATSSNEQAHGVQQVKQGLQQLEDVTQNNTATAEETSAAATDLDSQSNHIRQLISIFKVTGVQGGQYTDSDPDSRQLTC